MSERIRVAAEDELPSGERTMLETDNRSIGVFNVDGEYYAVENYCPHMGGPVCDGRVHGALKADWPGPGEREKEYYADEPAIACPWHGWEYDLESGVHLGDADYSVRTYDVVVDDGTIYVEV